jgi:GMP synthase (glutamine-hydrolysing)
VSLPRIAIIELGSQYTLVIARRLRELGRRSVILEPGRAANWLANNPVDAVILSGGYASVYEDGAPKPPEEIFALRKKSGELVPVLGICYGMQWLAHRLGGEVRAGHREYGPAEITTESGHTLFRDTPTNQTVWASHGDSVLHMPEGFCVTALNDSGGIAAMANEAGAIWGVQFHPEVNDTECGEQILDNFLGFAQCERDWQPSSMVAEIQGRAEEKIGNQAKIILPFSGGVDSTTVAKILSPVFNERLLAVTCDGGQLRQGEMDEIRHNASGAGVEHLILDAHALCGDAFRDITDAEAKRAIFKQAYTSMLGTAGQQFGASMIIQGTLATDKIESGATGGAKIKSHHNVGIDWNKYGLTEFYPIDHLFKYEVRALAREAGLPASVYDREPFPGPGLFIRVLWTPPTLEKLDIVRWADALVRQILKRHGIEVSQLVVAYAGVPTVGVKGDGRCYEGAALIRAVKSTDFMTAEGVWLPEEIQREITKTLIRHPKIVRTWYDPTPKPPGTVEFE